MTTKVISLRKLDPAAKTLDGAKQDTSTLWVTTDHIFTLEEWANKDGRQLTLINDAFAVEESVTEILELAGFEKHE